jgi:hypothetical protein
MRGSCTDTAMYRMVLIDEFGVVALIQCFESANNKFRQHRLYMQQVCNTHSEDIDVCTVRIYMYVCIYTRA